MDAKRLIGNLLILLRLEKTRGLKTLKIVALGDSLTVGETGVFDSNESASYPKYLETFAEEHLRSIQSDVRVNVLNRGINGDLTSGMLERFGTDVVNEKADYLATG